MTIDKKSLINWVGGKRLLRKVIEPLVPKDIKSYIEPFGGGAWVLFYKEKWAEIKRVLSDCPTSAEMLALTEKIGLKYDSFIGLYGQKKIDDAKLYAKDLKDRYTVLWMYYDLFN